MIKKALFGVVAVAVVVSGVAALSAFEAHIINVTAKIENALQVSTKQLEFGTVFPQEYLEEGFTISMSQSFIDEGRADDINYVIKQKTKCKLDPDYRGEELPPYAPVNYWVNEAGEHECPANYLPMHSLCEYLSKDDADPDDGNDTGVPSYFGAEGCRQLDPAEMAIGRLAKSQNDTSDEWIVDLKVPPFDGSVAQDWPADCPLLNPALEHEEFGCDLWIEVTDISRIPTPQQTNTLLSLENKDPDGWFVETDQTYGVLEFNPSNTTFDFTLTASGLQASTGYSLIYYADPWPGNGNTGITGALIWSGSSDASGEISVIGGSVDIGTDIPNADDANYGSGGGKIWLVLSSDYDSTARAMTSWNPTMYLYEYNLINYEDTDA